MKVLPRTGRFLIVVLSLVIYPAWVTVCSAEEFSRWGKTEVFGVVSFMGGDETSGSVEGIDATAEFDDSIVYGIGIGGNLDNHLNLNTEFLFGSTDVEGSALGITLEDDETLFIWNVNLDYNILKKALTPLVSGGIGLAHLSGDIVGGTDFTYNFGAGLRWDLKNNVFIKGMYRLFWADIEDMGDLNLDGFHFAVGVRF